MGAVNWGDSWPFGNFAAHHLLLDLNDFRCDSSINRSELLNMLEKKDGALLVRTSMICIVARA
jgi:hypothetical protein